MTSAEKLGIDGIRKLVGKSVILTHQNLILKKPQRETRTITSVSETNSAPVDPNDPEAPVIIARITTEEETYPLLIWKDDDVKEPNWLDRNCPGRVARLLHWHSHD